MTNDIRLINGDCLVEAGSIASGSVDLIVTDPPYGTVKGMRSSPASMTTGLSANEWDDAISPAELFATANRTLRRNGKLVLFAQEPYTSQLIAEAHANVPFSYRMIWEKDHFANSLLAKKAPVSYYEDIIVFSKNHPKPDDKRDHPLRGVLLKYAESYGKDKIIELFAKEGRYTSEASARVHASYKFGFNKGLRFDLMSRSLYDYLAGFIDFEEPYEELKRVDDEFKARRECSRQRFIEESNRQYPSVFNLWQGGKYKSNILRYKKDYDGFHPTQKPVALLEDLIRTYSNAGDLVCDLTMGSGSTGVAAVNTGRRFVGIERDADYFTIAERRINEIKAVSE